MDKKHKVVRTRLVMISVAVGLLVLSCSAQSEDNTHANGERLCQSGTDNCPHPTPNPEPVGPIHAADSLAEASGEEPERVCIPGTGKCNDPKKDRIINDPTEEAGSVQDYAPDVCDCDPKTHVCQGAHPGSFDASGKEDEDYASGESKYKSSEESESGYEPSPEAGTSKRPKPTNLMRCRGPPDHRICTNTHHSSLVSDDASAESQSSESDSSSDPSPPGSRMGCKGLPNEGHNCSGPHPRNSFMLESDEDGFAVDIHQEENTMSPLVCHPTTDGTTCQEPHHAFGIAQPGIKAA